VWPPTGSRWKFVGNSSSDFILRVGAFATQITILLAIPNVGFVP